MRRRCLLPMLLLMLSLSLAAQVKGAKDGWFKTSDGVRIHYLEAGSGPPMLFVPGWTMPGSIFQPQIEFFATNHHVIAVDPRSQGDSDKTTDGNTFSRRAQDYRELVDWLKLKNFVYVGWSLAAEEGVYYAGHLADNNVRAFVLVDGFVWDKYPDKMVPGMLGWMNNMQEDRAKNAAAFVRSMYKKPQSEQYINSIIQSSLKMPTNSAVASVASTLGVVSWEPSLKKIDRPVLYAHTPSTQATADLLKQHLGTNVHIEPFPNAGHALFVDEPEHFNKAVTEWLDSLPKQSALPRSVHHGVTGNICPSSEVEPPRVSPWSQSFPASGIHFAPLLIQWTTITCYSSCPGILLKAEHDLA